jgi:hypothetical protein
MNVVICEEGAVSGAGSAIGFRASGDTARGLTLALMSRILRGMVRFLRRMALGIFALFVGGIVAGAPWALADRVGWTPTGVGALGIVLGSYLLAGFVAAGVYTYLNDGGDALRGLARRPARRPRNRSI